MNRITRLCLIVLMTVMGVSQPLSAYSVYRAVASASLAPHDLVVNVTGSIAERMRPVMTEPVKYFNTLELFAETEQKLQKWPLLHPDSWNDFALFAKSNAAKPDSVLESIDRTSTVFGKAALAGMLVGAEGTLTREKLERRQAIVKTLMDNPEKLAIIEGCLQQLKALEPIFLHFFSDQQSDRGNLLSRFYTDRTDDPRFKMVNDSLDYVERVPAWYVYQGLADRLMTLLGVVGLVTTAQSLYSWVRGGFNLQNMYNDSAVPFAHAQHAAANWRLPAAALMGGYGVWKGLTNLESTLSQTGKAAGFPIQAFVNTPNNIKHLLVTNRILHEDLIQVAQGIETMRAMSAQLLGARVASLVPECNAFFVFTLAPEKLSNDLKSLVDMLQTSTFKGKPSLFCHFGRLFAANFLIKQTRQEWGRIFKSIGYLDAYVSLARLMKEHENARVKFCFAQYLDQDKPVIELKDFWYPVVGHERAVANDLTFGHQEQNIILTGPFASGKSTVMRGVGISVLMAQNLGIAPASSMKLTPFAMINTSMNISDSPTYDLSGLMSELDAAGKLLKRVIQRPREFCLNIFDEIFRATNESDGELILNRFVKKMAVPHALNIFATHKQGDKIRNLEQEFAQQKLFANYKVESPDGKKPDFKLKRGWTRQSLLHESTLQRFGF